MKKSIYLLFFAIPLISFEAESPSTKLYQFPILHLFPQMPVNEDNIPSVEGVRLGRFLFYDTILSENMDLACASCHRQEVAFSDAPKRLSEGSNGQISKRNTPGLFNLAWQKSYFWDGRASSIEEQVFEPVRGHSELSLDWKVVEERIRHSEFYQLEFNKAFNGQIDSITISYAIAQFERTIFSYKSKFDRVMLGQAYFTPQERDGYILMNDMTKGDCLHCHPTDGNTLMSTYEFSNNGLDSIQSPEYVMDSGRGAYTNQISDLATFKIPSLRNIALTPPYMHDGRFETLEEVMKFYSSDLHAGLNFDPKFGEAIYKGGVNLSTEEQNCIIAFLHTLTDSSLIESPDYSNPFSD